MTRVAALQMYLTPALQAATDGWWQGVAMHMTANGVGDVPTHLISPDDIHSVWHRDDLLLAQTCGAPLIRELGDQVQVIGTPAYDAPLSDGIHYRSAIIVGRNHPAKSLHDLAGGRVAINSRDSYSGYFALKAALLDIATPGDAYFGNFIISGAHRDSIRMVSEGTADVAAIDGVTFALAERDTPELTEKVRILETTPAMPGLPYITSAKTTDDELAAMRQALADAFSDPTLAEVRTQLMLSGFEETDRGDYASLEAMIDGGQAIVL